MPEEVKELIRRMLVVDPAQRITMREVAVSLALPCALRSLCMQILENEWVLANKDRPMPRRA